MTDHPPTTESQTQNRLLRNIFRRLALMLATACLVATAVLVVCQLLPLRYSGTTVFERRVDAAAKELLGDRNAESFASQKLTLQNELIGKQALTLVIRELFRDTPASGPARIAADKRQQELESRMADNLKINWRISSEQVDTVSLSYSDTDPAMAAKVPNLLVQLYFNRISDQIISRLKNSVDFLEQRRTDAEKARQEASAKRTDFLAKHAQEYAEPGSLQARIGQLTNDIRNYRPLLDLAKQREARLLVLMQNSAQPATQPSQEVWGPNPERARLREELAKVQADLLEATRGKGMKEQHPTVVALKRKIADLEQALEKSPLTSKIQDIFSIGQQTMQNTLDLAAARSEIQLYSSRLAQAQEELDRLQTRTAEYSRVSREYANLVKMEDDRREEVSRWNARLGDLRMQLGAEQNHRATIQTMIQQAKRPVAPSSPNFLLVLAGSVLGGIGAGVALVTLAAKMDHTFRSPEAAEEYFDIPIHGVIGEIATDRQKRSRLAKRLLLRPVVGTVLIAMVATAAWSMFLRLDDQPRYARFVKQPVPEIEATLEENVLRPLRQMMGI